jgi:hypothetical protein
MTAGAYRNLEPARAREPHRGCNVLRLLGKHDGGRIARWRIGAPRRSAARGFVAVRAAPEQLLSDGVDNRNSRPREFPSAAPAAQPPPPVRPLARCAILGGP